MRGNDSGRLAGRQSPTPAELAERRSGEPRVSVALFIAVMLSCFGLHVLLDGGGWWFELAVVTAIVLGAAALVRSVSRWRFLPSLAALFALAAYVIARFAADTAILVVLPGGDTIGRIGQLAGEASESILSQSVPATVDTGILLFLVGGVGVVALAADLIALGFRAPAAAGIPLAVLLAVPAMTNLDLSDGFAFALAAAGYLWLLLSARPHRGIRLSVAAGALAIVAALVVPLALPPVEAAGSGGGVFTTGVNPTIDLGKDLNAKVSTTALYYTTDSGDPHYLRLVTLEKFSGDAWEPDRPKQPRGNDVRSFSAPAGLSSDVATKKETTHIAMSNLRSPWLPLPYPTSSVTGLWGDWYWEDGSLAVSSPDASVANQRYDAESLVLTPTPKQLSAAGSVVPAAMDRYLTLPSDLPAVISDTARQVTADAQGSYAEAVALQEYFRGDAFRYSVEAPIEDGYDGTGMQVIARFLEAKSGYCVHFASAMAVMARTLGIPARIAVGFQGGTVAGTDSDGNNNYRVTSDDLHAWPELYFDEIGWVPFEPTPGRGSVPSYADLDVPGVPTPLSPAELAAQSSATPAPTSGRDNRADEPGDVGAGGSSSSQALVGWVWAAVIFLGFLALLLAPALARTIARSRRVNAGTAGERWREIILTASDAGLDLPATLTPRAAALALSPVAAGEQLTRLRIAVERESYADDARSSVNPADVRAVIARLLGGLEPRRRLLARLAPRSSWARILGLFARGD